MSNDRTPPHRAAIFAAIPVEYQAIRAHLVHLQEASLMMETACERGVFFANGLVWDVMIVETGAGTTRAAAETVRLIERFHPTVVLFVGIAGGLKDVELGDVIVASKIYGYESGRSDPLFRSRPQMYSPTRRIAQKALAASRKSDWLKRLRGTFPEPTEIPKVIIAPLASGNQVIASTAAGILQLLSAHYNDAAAVEMEGYGFLESASMYPHIEALIVRGISDLIDNKLDTNEETLQSLAACRASAFAFEVLATLERTELPAEKEGTTITQGKQRTDENLQQGTTLDVGAEKSSSCGELDKNLPDVLEQGKWVHRLLTQRTGFSANQYRKALEWLDTVEKHIQTIRTGVAEPTTSTRMLLAAMQKHIHELKAELEQFPHPFHFIQLGRSKPRKGEEYNQAIALCEILLTGLEQWRD